jgi:thiamine monophosphate kinase
MSLELWGDPPLSCSLLSAARPLFAERTREAKGIRTYIRNLAWQLVASAESLPVDARATLEQALHGGEDYELLFTAAPETAVPSSLGGVLVHAIGRMKKRGRGPLVEMSQRGKKRTALAAGGWEHFR